MIIFDPSDGSRDAAHVTEATKF